MPHKMTKITVKNGSTGQPEVGWAYRGAEFHKIGTRLGGGWSAHFGHWVDGKRTERYGATLADCRAVVDENINRAEQFAQVQAEKQAVAL